MFVSEFCLLCKASLAASWRRAREGGILRGGGGGGGADGGSRSADDVAVVVDGVDIYRENYKGIIVSKDI